MIHVAGCITCIRKYRGIPDQVTIVVTSEADEAEASEAFAASQAEYEYWITTRGFQSVSIANFVIAKATIRGRG